MEQDNIFRPQRHFYGALLFRVQQFCAHIFLFPLQKQLNTLNSFLFLPPHSLLSSSWLRKWSLFLFQSKRGKSYATWRLTFIFLFFSSIFSFFFLFKFLSEGNEMKKQKCNGLPAFNSYPVASYISKAATSVPFKWPLLFLFVHIRYKLWWMLYRSYSVIWPSESPGSLTDLRSSADLSLS